MLKGTVLSRLVSAVYGASSTTDALPPLAASAPAGRDKPDKREPPWELSPAAHLVLPIAIFVVTLLTIRLSHRANFLLTVWPTNAMILVAVLRSRPNLRNYGSILVGCACAILLASLATGNGVKYSAILIAINAAEIVVTWALLLFFQIDAANLASFRNLLKFIVLAGAIGPLATNAVRAATINSAYGLPWRTVWLHSYPAHALGMIIVVPFLISVTSPDWQALLKKRRAGEVAAILASVIAIVACGAYFRALIFMTVPVILFCTLRFGLIGATTSNLVTAVITTVFVVFEVGQPLLTRPEMSDRILALQVLLAFMSLWCLPLAALLKERDQLLGELSLANSQLKLESETQSHLVVGLRRHLSTAEEKERLRLSHELHDQAGQGLIAAILELNEIDALTQGAARERLHRVRKRMEELGKTLHRIAWELRPPAIDELGLRKALSSYIGDWSEQCGTEVDFHCDDANLDSVPAEIGTAVYRIVQEGLTNIVKHAGGPSNVSVIIRRAGATLQVTIEDNGCGFDVGAVAAKTGAHRGLGLDGMRERLTLLGGTLEIESAIGAGTTIYARIALDGQRTAA